MSSKMSTNNLISQLNSWSKSIRGRLTIWFVGSVALTFVFFVVVTAVVFWQVLNTQVDHHVQTVLNEVETIWHQDAGDRLQLIESLVASQGMTVMVTAPDGEILFATTSPDASLPTQHELQRHLVMLKNQETGLPHRFTINNTRFAIASTPIAPEQGVIGVGYSLGVLQDTIEQSLTMIGGLALVFIGILGALGYFLAKKALAPVVSIAKTAQTITTSQDLKGRIPDPGTRDELGELVQILNGMIVRLEKSFNVQQQFFADAAHTLKTPLTAIRTQLESIRGDVRGGRAMVGQAIATLDRVGRVVQDLLFLSQVSLPEYAKFERIDLSKVLGEVCELAEVLAGEKKIEIECRVAPDLYVRGDKFLLLRGVLNVVENAIRYTQNQGKVSITAVRDNEDRVVLTIADNGIGIPQDQLGRVYDRFFRARNAKGGFSGTGLGLAIAQAVVEAHAGEIMIESVEGTGTTVRMKFRG